ncbi:MAG: hypothetical protein SFX18_19800 [Pirellulales bacterium]|nr:hypothetical protein [Pirellulales bacterium]
MKFEFFHNEVNNPKVTRTRQQRGFALVAFDFLADSRFADFFLICQIIAFKYGLTRNGFAGCRRKGTNLIFFCYLVSCGGGVLIWNRFP